MTHGRATAIGDENQRLMDEFDEKGSASWEFEQQTASPAAGGLKKVGFSSRSLMRMGMAKESGASRAGEWAPAASNSNNGDGQLDVGVGLGQQSPDSEMIGIIFGYVLFVVSWLIIVVTFPLSMCFCLKVIKEYERVVLFRLGRLVSGTARGPGMIFIIPCIDSYRKIDLRVVSYAVPPQEILSKDSVTVSVDAVVYFRTSDPIASVNNVDDAIYSTKLLAQTTLRNALGMKTLTEMLTEREAIAQLTETILDEGTEHWGVKVERVEVKDIRLPQQLTRAMAAEAEAAREARAKVVAAEGEQKASRALREAAEVIGSSPVALQLRHLQTLASIAAEHNSTIIFPVPIDLMAAFSGVSSKQKEL